MRFLFTVIACVTHLFLYNQELYLIGLDTLTIYEDLKEIKKNKDHVYAISLKKRGLKEIPAEVFSCKNLLYLDLSKNKIQKIPAALDSLKQLRVLNLSSNRIDELPELVYNFKHLNYLQLGKNKIPYISSSLDKLKELVYLDLWSNEFYKIPAEISALKKLQKLDLRMLNFSYSEQKLIQSYLPKTIIYFSEGCDCD